jgi:diketogulonate reductase-like aldo/keto reductase
MPEEFIMAVPATEIRTTKLPSGVAVPVLGQGTWHFGENPARRAEEIESLRHGLDLGMTLIDTAEMYGDGAAEELIAEAIQGRRDEVFLVSKVLPHHATFDGTVAACKVSRRRLRTKWLDLYLLHWRGDIPLAETVAAFEALKAAGAIRHWGVSNFDIGDMEDLVVVEGGENVETDQVLYNLVRRGIEYDLMPWADEEELPLMAYSPIEQGRLPDAGALAEVAARHHVTPAQVALAWVLRHEGVIAIPKAASPAHVDENRAALDLHLSVQDIAHLNRAFPPPRSKVPLEML